MIVRGSRIKRDRGQRWITLRSICGIDGIKRGERKGRIEARVAFDVGYCKAEKVKTESTLSSKHIGDMYTLYRFG